MAKLLRSLDSINRHFVFLLIRRKSDATKHLRGNADLIELVWKRCAILFLMVNKSQKARSRISSMPVSLQKSKWTTFLDKLSSSDPEDQNTLHMTLFLTLLQESISIAKGCRPFWTHAFKELSERLLSPTGTESVGSDLTSSANWYPKREVKLPSLMINEIKARSKSSQKTSSPLFTSTVADKWAREAMPEGKEKVKAIMLKIHPNKAQQKVIDEWIHTSNYVYNKTVEELNKNSKQGFIDLRDKLVTNMTKKSDPRYSNISSEILKLHDSKNTVKKELQTQLAKLDKYIDKIGVDDPKRLELCLLRDSVFSGFKIRIETLMSKIKESNEELRRVSKDIQPSENISLKDWELSTPKEMRAAAVKDATTAFKACFTNLRNGNIRYFNVGYRKHTESHKYVNIPKNMIKIENNNFIMTNTRFGKDNEFAIGRRQCERFKKRNQSLRINHDCKIVKKFHEYWVVVPCKVVAKNHVAVPKAFVGVDPGCRTFMTVMDHDGFKEYQHDSEKLKRINKKIALMKARRIGRNTVTDRIRKRKIHKHEDKKLNIIDNVHWHTIQQLLSLNDVIVYGDIKSHGIVKGGKNKTLNTMFNDLRFFTFKQRLLFKAELEGKLVIAVNESYTTKTCCCCGNIYDINSSKIYSCKHCGMVADRDCNGAKNILMKGVLSN